MFSHFVSRMSEFLRREDGPTAVEYAVMLALIVGLCLAAVSLIGEKASNNFYHVGVYIGDHP